MIRRLRSWLSPPSIHPILAEIDRRGLQFSSYRHIWRSPAYYTVSISIDRDGVECSVKGEGPTFDAALIDAWRKWP
jgi:hypothetical protein